MASTSAVITGDERAAFRDTLRRFVDRELMPGVEAWEEAGEFPADLYLRAGELGLLGIGFPEEYGGSPGDSTTTRGNQASHAHRVCSACRARIEPGEQTCDAVVTATLPRQHHRAPRALTSGTRRKCDSICDRSDAVKGHALLFSAHASRT